MKLQPVIPHTTAPGIRAFSLIEALVSACIVGVLFVCIHPANPLEEAKAGEVCGCD